MFKNLPLAWKFSLLPLLTGAGFLLFVAYTYIQLSDNNQRLQSLERRIYPVLESTDEVIFSFSLLPTAISNAVASAELDQLEEVRREYGKVISSLQQLRDLTAEQPEIAAAQRNWQQAVETYISNALNTSEQLIAGTASFDDLRVGIDRIATDLEAVEIAGERFREAAYQDFISTLGQAGEANALTIQVGVMLFVVLMLVVGIVAWGLISSVMTNVRGVIASLTTIAQGNGDLTQRVNVDSADEFGEMINLFNHFLEKLQGTIRQAVEATQPLTQVSSELYTFTKNANESSKSRQKHTESIGHEIQVMTDSIKAVAKLSQQAASETGAASRQTQEVMKGIGVLSGSVENLGVSMADSMGSMSELKKETELVGSVLDVIRSIAEQTNLLALNAAIEAARAGEQGRGFAVVADEVRNLAQKTAASTAEIQQIIHRLQASASNVLESMTDNCTKAQDSAERSVEATRLLETITLAVEKIEKLNSGIAKSTDEQISLSNGIQNDTGLLLEEDQKLGKGAEATARLSETLVDCGDRLRAVTSQFRA
ncbi:MAG: methyl-accepting chemotaxis protein [Pseudomonadales bacterium]|nr:methyl-accepting chemotaxis protein [Pseudomonadales bacterium]